MGRAGREDLPGAWGEKAVLETRGERKAWSTGGFGVHGWEWCGAGERCNGFG